MTNKSFKVGLALGGGYARGLAHIGVLEVLERAGIPIDMIAGTSMGALVGALYAKEKDAALVKKQAVQINWKDITKLVDLTIPKSGLIGGKRVTNLLRRFIGDPKFKELCVPLSCVATDIISGDEVVINEGSVLEAVRASISIPIIFTVIKKNGRYLVDGGLVDPVPVRVLKKMGADFIIAVDVTPDKSERINHLLKDEEVKEPGIFQVMVQSIYITTYLSSRTVSRGANVVVHPRLAQIGPGEFHRAQECIMEGEMAALDSLPRIMKGLETSRGLFLKDTPKPGK